MQGQSNPPVAKKSSTCDFTIGGFTTITAGGGCDGSASSQFFNGQVDEASIYNRALTDTEITSIFNAGIAGKLKENTTPTGFSLTDFGLRNANLKNVSNDFSPQAVSTTVGDATVTFPSVSTAGTTQEIPLDASLFPAPTMATHTGLIYDIATTAAPTANAVICFNLPAFTTMQFSGLRILHFVGNSWIPVTDLNNSTFPTLCTMPLSSFSPFAIVNAVPTAANVSVSGRISNGIGGIDGAIVQITDQTGATRTTRSSSFGYYRFDDIEVGQTYIIQVISKRSRFQTRIVTVNEELTDLNFTAEN